MKRKLNMLTVYTLVDKGKIEVEEDLKPHILRTFENFGILEETKTKKRYWRREPPVQIIDEITHAIEELLSDEERQEAENMEEHHIDLHRRLYVRLIRIRRHIRRLMGEVK